MPKISAKTPKSLLLNTKIIVTVLLVVCFGFLLGIRLYNDHPITGDEPHYLLMDYSLIHDHDLNLKNNYQQNHSASFYPGLGPELQVGNGQGKDNSDRWYSIHGIGLPLLLLPGFWLAGKAGAIVTMVLLATATVWLSGYWTWFISKSKWAAGLAAASLAACYSFNGLAGYLYPDIVIAGLTLASLIIIEKYYSNIKYQLLVAVMAGFLPLLHFKALAVSLPLIGLLIFKNFKHKKPMPWLPTAIFIGFLSILLLSNHGWFGVWNLTKIYPDLQLYPATPITIVSAYLFDSMRGLLIYNPVLLLIVLGLPAWFVRQRESFIDAILVTVLSIGGLAVFAGWNGGDSQIGRYAMDFLPVFLPAMAFAAIELKDRWKRSIPLLLILATIFVTIFSVTTKRDYVRFDMRSPMFVSIERHVGIAVDRLLPTISGKNIFIGKHDWLKIVVWYIFMLAVLVYGIWLARSHAKTKGYKILLRK